MRLRAQAFINSLSPSSFEAAVEDRAASTPGASSTATPVPVKPAPVTTVVAQPPATSGAGVLRDPNNILSKRSVFYDYDSEVIKDEYRPMLQAHAKYLADNPNAFIMGQGVDDFKGIFGSTTGLAEKYGAARVFDVPLMEEGMTGIAIGAALVGDYPITTHIRADFTFLAMNQIINLASKYRYMFGGQASLPVVFRSAMFYGLSTGAHHSDRPYPMYMNVPGLKIIAPASRPVLSTTASVRSSPVFNDIR